MKRSISKMLHSINFLLISLHINNAEINLKAKFQKYDPSNEPIPKSFLYCQN